MGTRAVLQVFERYQKERVAFVSAVAEISKSPQVTECSHACLMPSARLQTDADRISAAECRGFATGWRHVLAAAIVAGQCSKVGHLRSLQNLT